MENKQLDGFKNELKVIGDVVDLLKSGTWNGAWAQKLAIAQMYTAGLYANLKAEIDKRAAAPEPVVESPVENATAPSAA